MKQYTTGLKVASNEQVTFFDGSISTKFPKFNKKQKLTPQFLKKLRHWLLSNTYNTAVKNGNKMYVIDAQEGLHTYSKAVPQAIMDSCEYYLANGTCK